MSEHEHYEQNEDNLETEPILLFEERVLVAKNPFDKVVVGFFSVVTVVCSISLALLISAAAFTRYVIRGDLYGYEEWVKLIAFWLYFMGGAYGAYNDTHVSADLIDSYLPEGKPRQFMIFIRQLITSVMSLYFTFLGYEFFMFGFMGPLGTGVALPRTTVWQIPLWTSYLAIFSGLIFMSIYFSRRCFHSGMKLFSKGECGARFI